MLPRSSASSLPLAFFSVKLFSSLSKLTIPVENLNTLTYLVINAKALQRVRSINAALLAPIRLRE